MCFIPSAFVRESRPPRVSVGHCVLSVYPWVSWLTDLFAFYANGESSLVSAICNHILGFPFFWNWLFTYLGLLYWQPVLPLNKTQVFFKVSTTNLKVYWWICWPFFIWYIDGFPNLIAPLFLALWILLYSLGWPCCVAQVAQALGLQVFCMCLFLVITLTCDPDKKHCAANLKQHFKLRI